MHRTDKGDKIHLKVLCDERSALPITHISLSSTISIQTFLAPVRHLVSHARDTCINTCSSHLASFIASGLQEKLECVNMSVQLPNIECCYNRLSSCLVTVTHILFTHDICRLPMCVYVCDTVCTTFLIKQTTAGWYGYCRKVKILPMVHHAEVLLHLQLSNIR